MNTPETSNNNNDYIPVKNDSAIYDMVIATAKTRILIILIVISIIALGTTVPFFFIKDVPRIICIIIPACFSPALLLLFFLPHTVKARLDTLNHNIVFYRIGFIPFPCNCCRNSLNTDDISEFTMEKFRVKKHKNFKINANFKSGNPSEMVCMGEDTTCSINYDPKVDVMMLDLNRWLQDVQ